MSTLNYPNPHIFFNRVASGENKGSASTISGREKIRHQRSVEGFVPVCRGTKSTFCRYDDDGLHQVDGVFGFFGRQLLHG
jgi:hypothetical protein